MLRLAASLVAVPFVLVLLLAGAMEVREGQLGWLTAETFELGPLSVVVVVGLVMFAVFLPLLWLASRFIRITFLSTAVIGLNLRCQFLNFEPFFLVVFRFSNFIEKKQ